MVQVIFYATEMNKKKISKELVADSYSSLSPFQVQKEVHLQLLRWQERSYGVVSPAAKGSQMDTPF